MGKRIGGLSTLLCLTLCVSCVSATEDDAGRDFEFFFEDGSLDEVDFTLDAPGNNPTTTVEVDRERSGARFAWGGEVSRGYFHVIREDLTYMDSGLQSEFEMAGVGGGAMGSPTVGDVNGDLVWMVPWRIDGTLFAGEDDQTDPNVLAYVEVHADLGFGFQWKSFRPSIGVAFSSIGGRLAPDDSNMTQEDFEVEARNRGFFFDVRFLPEGYPVYGHFRALTGDYEATTFGIGLKF